MISQLRGTLITKDASSSLIDVAGVGYEIATSLNTFSQLPNINQELSIYTHFVVREDAQLLYGFYTSSERDIFRILIKINGIGPKVALAILSHLNLAELSQTIANNDINKIIAVPGIGKKTGQRLMLELSDKLENVGITSATTKSTVVGSNSKNQAAHALTNLGYKQQQIDKWLQQVGSDMSVEDILHSVLKKIGSNS